MEKSTKNNECNGIVNYMPQDAKNGITIAPPDGFEVDKIEVVDGYLHATFKAEERKLPKTWEEFCENYLIKTGEAYIRDDCGVDYVNRGKRCNITDRNILPDRHTAEAVLALCQLIQLRNAYNGDWVPDWKDKDEIKHIIQFDAEELHCDTWIGVSASPLYFKTAELRDEFLRNFRDLIEKLKPLYGIKEGGEE